MKKILLIISCIVLCFALTSCDILGDILGNQNSTNENEEFDTNKVTLTSAYTKAQELGFEGTLEEFIEYISGEDGKDGKDGINGTDGKDGVGITSVLVDSNGELIVILSDGRTINCGKVKGSDGKDGINGTNGVDGKPGKDGVDGKTPYIQDGYWYIDGENTGVKAEGVDGENGDTGVGIEKVEFDDNGNLLITYTDGTTQTVELPSDSEVNRTVENRTQKVKKGENTLRKKIFS